jgi:hypothetical protein
MLMKMIRAAYADMFGLNVALADGRQCWPSSDPGRLALSFCRGQPCAAVARLPVAIVSTRFRARPRLVSFADKREVWGFRGLAMGKL